ncbi:MAG: hypothetical protein Q3Y08_00775, partial [Butyricicoccus sp.]|nr:hypothetical protein [Butyricicoccus sp.]
PIHTEPSAAPEAPAPQAPAPEAPAAQPILRRSRQLLEKQKAGVPYTQSPIPGEPILGKRRNGLPIIAGLIVAALAVIAAVVFLIVPSVIQLVSPKAYLTACAGRTLASYSSAWKDSAKAMGVDGLYDTLFDKRIQYTMEGTIEDFPDTPMLNGAGFSSTIQFDRKGRELAAELSAEYGSIDLGSAQLYLKDDLIAVGSPNYTDGEFYGIHTETLGQDVKNAPWGADADVDENLSFNVFDLLDLYRKPTDLLTKKTYAALGKEAAGLLGDSDIEKLGKKDKRINGESETLKMYAVDIAPEDLAMRMYNSADLILKDENLYQLVEPLLSAQAAQRDMTASEMYDEFRDQLLDQLDPDDMADSMGDVDIELVIGLRGKQIAFMELSIQPDGAEKMSISAEIGTAESIISALTIEAANGNEPVYVIKSASAYESKDGVFNSWFWITEYNSQIIYTNMEWDTKSKDVLFEMKVPGASVSGEGTLDANSKSLDAQLDNVEVTSGGDSMTLSLHYALETCKKFAFTADDAKILTDMDERDILDMANTVQERVQEAVYGEIFSRSFSSSYSGSSYTYDPFFYS